MSLIYALFWLVLGADIKAVDILLFVYCDVLTIAFWGLCFTERGRRRKMTREEALKGWVIPALKNTWNEKKINEILKALEQTSEDCISRQAVQNLTATLLSDYLHDEDREKIEKLDAEIGDLPSIQPKKGEWILHPFEHVAECSVCKAWVSIDMMTNYCPNCGADMRGDKE